MKKQAIAIFVALAMVLTGFTMLVPNVSAVGPFDVVVSDETSNSFTVTWSTSISELSSIEYGTVGFTTGGGAGSIGTVGGGVGTVHSAKATTGLGPGTTYEFYVYDGGPTYYGPYSAATLGTSPGASYPVYGYVNQSDGVTPAVGVSVVVDFGGVSYSGVTDASGRYFFNVYSNVGGDITIYGGTLGYFYNVGPIVAGGAAPENIGSYVLGDNPLATI
ncbi:MAG: fibronectin type III domain-containing protein, partial [Thermoplasmata archaeon]|nr:fibronectin type III domain-containing protein [Thermoplasmata archaeon]